MAVVGDHALPIRKIHQALVMLGRDVDEVATGVPACGMCDLQPRLWHGYVDAVFVGKMRQNGTLQQEFPPPFEGEGMHPLIVWVVGMCQLP